MSTESKIADGHVVEIEYTLKNDAGEIIDASEGHGPLAYIHGKQNIVPGLEKEITGKVIGDKFSVVVVPEEGYGVRNEQMVQSVPKAQFGADVDQIQVGMQFQVEDMNGQLLLVTAVEIQDDAIVLDGNHPLAGQNLNFDIEVVSMRDATEEELAHGHLHGGAGCCGGTSEECCDDDGGSCGDGHCH
jgi:FKBP-type peptidyl-prolyl cis-trans isomerase SlyD